MWGKQWRAHTSAGNARFDHAKATKPGEFARSTSTLVLRADSSFASSCSMCSCASTSCPHPSVLSMEARPSPLRAALAPPSEKLRRLPAAAALGIPSSPSSLSLSDAGPRCKERVWDAVIRMGGDASVDSGAGRSPVTGCRGSIAAAIHMRACRHRCAKRNVAIVAGSASWRNSHAAKIERRAFPAGTLLPPRASRSSHVSFESR
eukprot:scaffold78565_cov69-Phaeocystis_antarctica.AAC.2